MGIEFNSDFFLEAVNKYYPEHIQSGTPEYINSEQSRRLNALIQRAHKKEDYILNFKKFLIRVIPEDKTITVEDYSMFGCGDRCHNIQLVRDLFDQSRSHSICINISLLIPFYTIHVLEVKRSEDYRNRIDVPRRRKELEDGEYKRVIQRIKEYLNEEMNLNDFPEELIEKVIPNISFENSDFGSFTFYNAFFLNEFYTR